MINNNNQSKVINQTIKLEVAHSGTYVHASHHLRGITLILINRFSRMRC